MGVDGDLTSIINDIVQFLESLYDVQLPSKIENVRVNLLHRSKTKLASLSSIGQRGSASPEPYLDMNAGKGFLLFPKKKNCDIEIEEYVGVEDQQLRRQSVKSVISTHQDYYESFQAIVPVNEETNNEITTTQRSRKSWRKLSNSEDHVDNRIRETYRTFTAAKTSSTARKSGTLYHKLERKPFGFVRGNVRLCWIGLVGSHLLIHGSEDDKQSPDIYSIRGYTARPAPNSVSRDPERAKSAFEIFCPGNKTLQFIAKSPKEMEEWLTAINQKSEKNHENEDEKCEEEIDNKRFFEEKYQDVGELLTPALKLKDSTTIVTSHVNDDSIEQPKRDSIILTSVTPPALPVRTIPRSLPSLPSEKSQPIASYEPLDEAYEEDDIYHRIEDFRENQKTSYENVKKKTKKFNVKSKKKRKRKEIIIETYDDVENKEASKISDETMETYDDVRSIVCHESTNNLVEHNSTSSRKDLTESPEEISRLNNEPHENYDDVIQISPSKGRKDKKIETKESTRQTKTETIAKSPQKRSFLDRVRHRKDSPKKEEKKKTKEIETEKKNEKKKSSSDSSNSIDQRLTRETELPMYDDVSELTIETNFQNENASTNLTIVTDDISNYNCPPPPRPIYAKPPSQIIVVKVKNNEEPPDEFYDDIGIHRNDLESTSPNDNPTIFNSNSRETVAVSVQTENFTPEKYKNNICPGNCTNSRISSSFEDEKKFCPETEHYQTPRRDSMRVDDSIVEQQQEQLYDDIAILEDFRAKQRDSSMTSGFSNDNSSVTAMSHEKLSFVTKKPWNRFGSGKKLSCRDSPLAQTSAKNLSSGELDNGDITDFPVAEKQETGKLNKLQKLIYKMENTLGKQPSSKSVTTVLNKNA